MYNAAALSNEQAMQAILSKSRTSPIPSFLYVSLSQLTKANLYVGPGIPIYSFCFKRLFIRLSTAFIYSVVVT